MSNYASTASSPNVSDDGNRMISNKNGKLNRTTRQDLNNPPAQIATDTNSTGALISDYHYTPAGMARDVHRGSTGADRGIRPVPVDRRRRLLSGRDRSPARWHAWSPTTAGSG